MTRYQLIPALSLLLTAVPIAGYFNQTAGANDTATVRRNFLHPPDDARVMMRWWWFGSAVTEPELERELKLMHDAGIGGVEIQPVYPLELDDPAQHIRNLPYVSEDFLKSVSFTSEKAKELGMRVDVTLGSGWPYGGPHVPITEAAGRLRCDRVVLENGQHSVAIPPLENGEKLITIYLATGDRQHVTAVGRQLTDTQNGRVQIAGGAGASNLVLFFISSRSGQQVKRAAVGAEGYVLDHYDRAAIDHHLNLVATPLLRSFGNTPPHSVFSDSLEVFASDWTSDLLPEFQRRRGYDLTPHLPELVLDTEDAPSIRHDWGKTLTELVEERYLKPVNQWAHQHGTLFRSQTYGEPPAILSSNRLVDLPEGEAGPHWRGFSTARWASSASHLYGRPVTSTETWTWLHSPAFRATPLDMKAEADLHFIEGISQLVGHGWPYSPANAGEPGWRFYAAAAFNEHNPWFQIMPEMTAYLQRMSYLMRQGKPANDIAIYLPTDDAWAGFRPGKTSVDRSMEDILGSTLIPQVLNAGYNFDFIDDRAMADVGVPYKVLIVPGVERMPLATLKKLQQYQAGGGKLIATRRLPSRAPGFVESKTDTPQIAALSKQLFEGSVKTEFLPDENKLGDVLHSLVDPDFAVTAEAAPSIGFIHRKLADSDLYFVVNTSNKSVATRARIRSQDQGAEKWNAFTGEIQPAEVQIEGDHATVGLNLAPYESEVLVFSAAAPKSKVKGTASRPNHVDLSADWKVTFLKTGQTIQMNKLHSWADEQDTRFYSGEVAYEKTIRIDSGFKSVVLDFGNGEPVAPSGPPGAPGMRALLESPVRESALVYVNGSRAGSVWLPPYQVDLTKSIHPGNNQLRIVVANTAINEIAGKALPSYRLLNLRYGERFVPQGFENIEPLPSGITGPLTLSTAQ